MRQERPYHSDSTASRLLSEALSGQVSTTVGDHVGIPGVVLLLLLPFILAPAPAYNTIHYSLCTYYPHSSFLLLGLSVSSKRSGGRIALHLREVVMKELALAAL